MNQSMANRMAFLAAWIAKPRVNFLFQPCAVAPHAVRIVQQYINA